ncbi:MAG: isochorismatase family protein, partial [Gemmataceae bacterium]
MLRRISLLVVLLVGVAQSRGAEPAPVLLETLGRTRVKDKAGQWIVTYKPLRWNAAETAVILCDMWDDHYCQNAARRVAEMAPVMNEVVKQCRDRGMLIIHCPSGCMDVYKDTAGRKLAQQAPVVPPKVPLKNWCHLDPEREAPLPIDVTEPCDDEKPREKKRFYSKQIDSLEIKPGDAITDSAEAYYLMRQKKIKNVIVMGVHTNMCVLGRPFGIRQLVYQGLNV